jgi:hypothetical protein
VLIGLLLLGALVALAFVRSAPAAGAPAHEVEPEAVPLEEAA